MDATQRWMRDDLKASVCTMVETEFLDDLDDDDELTRLQEVQLFDLWISSHLLPETDCSTHFLKAYASMQRGLSGSVDTP